MNFSIFKKVTLIALVFSGIYYTVKAQVSDPAKERKWRIDFGGAIGLFAPFDQVAGEPMLLGTTSQTTVQFNYKKQFFGRVQLGETSVGYKSNTASNGINSMIDANSNSINLGLGFGYHRGLGNWVPFIVAGLGPSLVRHPQADIDATSNTVNYSNDSKLYLYGNVGLGVNYNLSKSIMLLLECQATKIANLPKTPSTHLSGISALINVKFAL
ncbi:outer membrane beta-barrel protein [Pedobacter sp. GR22-10]|uniref:outer membrane beta-barrel protein n=1 Tax=Pedobacter sp. GR22-10 TaxID=2994472 RepID=UPI0022482AC3|nr:outer membrane beta-barrel protein [Pedobacter sp. GR22-10]MCX2431013.1 outer membrane beta-barrel protein [Pedobacter sp. GR22-10]